MQTDSAVVNTSSLTWEQLKDLQQNYHNRLENKKSLPSVLLHTCNLVEWNMKALSSSKSTILKNVQIYGMFRLLNAFERKEERFATLNQVNVHINYWN